MKWQELPEEDRAYVTQALGQMVFRRREDVDWLRRVNPAASHIALYERMIVAHEAAIAVLEAEPAPSPGEPPFR